MMELFSLAGKTALVTGGSRGLGLEMAEALGQAGARVMIVARREEWLLPAVAELRQKGIECAHLPGDIADPADANRFCAETVARFGSLDVLVNNAGISWWQNALEMPLEQWERVFRINATGTFLMSQAAGRHMLAQQSGSIINIASVTGLFGCPPAVLDTIGYTASKGAVVALSRDLAVKWAPQNVRVNVVAPWFFRTRMTESHIEGSEALLAQQTPMGRIGQSGELNGVVVFLASAAAAYITGQCICVDGGLSAT